VFFMVAAPALSKLVYCAFPVSWSAMSHRWFRGLSRIAHRGAWLLLLALGSAQAAELTVSAATSLTTAFRALTPLFEAQHPGVKLRLNFGASGSVLQQIARGAPVDVFASADAATMDRAESQRLLAPGQRHDFASNSLVVIVPRGAARPTSLADLAQPAFRRVAIGVPGSVPAGRYARSALEQAGLWETVAPKTVGAQNVRQALDYVARAEVDAGFVYATDAALLPGALETAFEVPVNPPVRYPIAVLTKSPEPLLARQFVTFVLSAPAQAELARHGFRRP
jgi:molybdate transport system substrate-binding protein